MIYNCPRSTSPILQVNFCLLLVSLRIERHSTLMGYRVQHYSTELIIKLINEGVAMMEVFVSTHRCIMDYGQLYIKL